MASMKDILFPSSTRTLKTARKQCFEECDLNILKPHRASRCHTSASVCQRFPSTNTEKQSQRFTWISNFGFLPNLLTSILDSVTVFVCSESKVLKHNELNDHTWNRLLTTMEFILTSWPAFLTAFLLRSTWNTTKPQTARFLLSTNLAGSISSQMALSKLTNGTRREQIGKEA